jgi:membrane associated rhomboid family serine protease
MIGNLAAFWTFGYRACQALGSAAFFGLYIAGSVGCSIAHCAYNQYMGRLEAPLPAPEVRRLVQAEVAKMTKEEKDRSSAAVGYLKTMGTAEEAAIERIHTGIRERAEQIVFMQHIQPRDLPSVGASGAVMAISYAGALLFPLDLIVFRGFMVPLPAAVGLYTFSDIQGVVNPQPFDNTGHAGHLLGGLAGLLWVAFRWYAVRRLPNARLLGVNGHLPIFSMFRRMKFEYKKL